MAVQLAGSVPAPASSTASSASSDSHASSGALSPVVDHVVDLGGGISLNAAALPQISRLDHVRPAEPFPFTDVSHERYIGEGRLVFIMGGTNIRIGMVNAQMEPLEMRKIGWEEICRLPQYQDLSEPARADQLMRDLAREADIYLRDHSMRPLQIARIGFPIAGPGEEIGGESFYTTGNTNIRLTRYPVASKLKEELQTLWGRELKVNKVNTINDGEADLRGEQFHPNGSLRGILNGCFVGLGTGIGGDGPGQKEIGHTYLRRAEEEIDRFIHISYGELEELGYVKDGEYQKLPDNLEYWETLNAGPWIAVRFVQHFEQSQLAFLAEEINRRQNGNNLGAQTSELDSLRHFLREYRDLGWQGRVDWGQKTRGSVINAVMDLLFMSPAWLDAGLDGIAPNGDRRMQVYSKAAAFQKTILREMGECLGLIQLTSGADRVVVGNGLMENMHPDHFATILAWAHLGSMPEYAYGSRQKRDELRLEFLRAKHTQESLLKTSRIVRSQISGEEREAVGSVV